MYIKKICLKNYRNIDFLDLSLKNGINIFYGDNAQGKTNLLESIYMCATGRSHRTHIDKELIKFNELDAHIKAEIQTNTLDKIDIHLKKDTKKGIAINNIPINKLGELFGILNVVIFSPEDLNLIKAGPMERRKFIDMELCQINKVYYYNLSQYHKILKQRNALLIKFRKKIIEIREEFIFKINSISKKIHSEITGQKEDLEIIYKPNVSKKEFEKEICQCFF